MIQLNITGGYGARAPLRYAKLGRITCVHRDGNLLETQKNIDDIFLNAFDTGVLVEYSLYLGFGNSSTRHRRQQDATQRIAERVTETAFERLDDDFCLQIVDRRYFDYARLQKFVY
jgi:hypothetical protein